MKKVLLLLVSFMSVLTLAACYDSGRDSSTLRLNVGQDSTAFTVFNESTPYEALNGVTYNVGDLLPSWQIMADTLGITLTDAVSNKSAKTQARFETALLSNFSNEDIISGKVTQFNEYGDQYFVELSQYIESGDLPNLAQFLEDYPAYADSMTDASGDMYFAPYFDGNDDITKMFMVRHDLVKLLLDETPTYDQNDSSAAANYNSSLASIINAMGKYSAFYADGHTTGSFPTTTEDVSVQRTTATAGNVITRQNAVLSDNSLTASQKAEQLCTVLTSHIDTVVNAGSANYTEGTSNGFISYANRSDFYLSGAAVYDADEMIALMRCAKANAQYLVNQNILHVFYPRETKDSRLPAVEYLAEMFGVRGSDSPLSISVYIDENGQVANRYGEADMHQALVYINQMYSEGLILANYDQTQFNTTNFREYFFLNNNGFMTHDYNASTVGLHDKTSGKAVACTDTAYTAGTATVRDCYGTQMEAILAPIAQWFDDNNDGTKTFERYTDSVRTLKDDAWGIPKHVAEDAELLANALAVIDYPYGEEGSMTMIFGPSEYWTTAAERTANEAPAACDATASFTYNDVEYAAFVYGGENYPCMNTQAREEFTALASGNVTNYHRKYLGATLSFGHVRPLALENQYLNQEGLNGVNMMTAALATGAMNISQLELNTGQSKGRILTPSSIALTDGEQAIVDAQSTLLTTMWENSVVCIIKSGYNGCTTGEMSSISTREQYTTYVQSAYNTWKGIYQTAYERKISA